jgi:hypothetical protein
LAAEGEPPRKITPAERHARIKRQVALCRAAGMSDEAIAGVMQVSVEDLRVAFQRELKFGREIVCAEELTRLDAASAAGNVPAAKALLATAGGTDKEISDRRNGDATRSETEAVNRAALRILNGGKNGS